MLSSVKNALRVLEYLVKNGEGGVSEMGRSLELSPGTVHRLVSTLVESGFADQNAENRKYMPGTRILELANAMRSRIEFLDLAHGHLERLMERAGETVNLAVLRRSDVVYVDRVVSNQTLAVEVRIGSHVPAYCTALGKALLAFGGREALDGYLERLDEILQDEGHYKPNAAELKTELAKVKTQGYAEDNREFSPDIMCVAAPILNSRGRAIAAVSLSGPATRFGARRESLVPMVEIAGKELTLLLQALGEDSPSL